MQDDFCVPPIQSCQYIGVHSEPQVCKTAHEMRHSSYFIHPSPTPIVTPTYSCSAQTIPYSFLATKKHVKPKPSNPAVMHQNHIKVGLSSTCPGTKTFMPHMPVIMFMGRTIVPTTVSLPRMSAFFSARSFMLMLIWAT